MRPVASARLASARLASARLGSVPLAALWCLVGVCIASAGCGDPSAPTLGDAGGIDAGSRDAGGVDAARADGGAPADGGAHDGARPDGASEDGALDGSLVDAALDVLDASGVDGSMSDAGAGDAGTSMVAGCDRARFLLVSSSAVAGGVVLDRTTGLRWARWTQRAALSCAALGMRIPSVAELRSLVVPRGEGACFLDECAFPGDRCGPTLAVGGRAFDFLNAEERFRVSSAQIRCVR